MAERNLRRTVEHGYFHQRPNIRDESENWQDRKWVWISSVG